MSTTSYRGRSRRQPVRRKKRKEAKAQRPKGTYLFGLITPSTKIKTTEVVAFSRELATLLESGIPMVRSLSLMAEQRAGKPFEAIILEMIDDLNSGMPLAESMAKHPKVFDRFYTRTIATSDHGAPVIGALQQAAGFLDTAESAMAQAKKAMIYPMIVLTLGFAVTVLMLVVALPPMIDLFSNMGNELPLPTKILIGLSNGIRSYQLELALVIAAVVVGGMKYFKSPRGRRNWHRASLHIPVLSNVIIQTDMARIASALSSLVDAGLSLPEALEVASETASNELIREALVQVRGSLLAGDGLAGPMAETGIFPLTMTQALRVGEDTGTLDANLRRMAEYYQRASSDTVKSFVALLEPLSTVVIALVVGFIAVAVIMPMYSALGSLE